MGNSEKIGYAFPYFGNFSKFFWNKLYHIRIYVDIWTLYGVTIKNTGHYMWPTMMLITIWWAYSNTAYTDLWGVYICMGTYRCMEGHIDIWGHIDVWGTYGHIEVYRCMGCTDNGVYGLGGLYGAYECMEIYKHMGGLMDVHACQLCWRKYKKFSFSLTMSMFIHLITEMEGKKNLQKCLDAHL